MFGHIRILFYQRIFIVLILHFLINGNALFSQGIYTGNLVGQGIIYNPLSDIYIMPEGPKATECYEMDFNQDGVYDLVFCATIWERWDSINHITEVYSAQNTSQMILYPPEPEWIYQLSANYWVGPDDNWTYSGILRYQRTTPYGYAYGGIFDEGYIGFRIPVGDEYIYGWVRLIASTIGIVIQKYAYQTILTSEQEYPADDQVKVFPNPALDNICFKIPYTPIRADIFNLAGIRISSTQNPANSSIDVSMLGSGIYILKITCKDREPIIEKFVKE